MTCRISASQTCHRRDSLLTSTRLFSTPVNPLLGIVRINTTSHMKPVLPSINCLTCCFIVSWSQFDDMSSYEIVCLVQVRIVCWNESRSKVSFQGGDWFRRGSIGGGRSKCSLFSPVVVLKRSAYDLLHNALVKVYTRPELAPPSRRHGGGEGAGFFEMARAHTKKKAFSLWSDSRV
jgi:hypothetical protein